jgi:hypothetical protein
VKEAQHTIQIFAIIQLILKYVKDKNGHYQKTRRPQQSKVRQLKSTPTEAERFEYIRHNKDL